MRPALSVILFSTLSGVGYGIWFWVGTGIALHMKGGSIYANHVIPLTGYRVAGVLWHQGEDDTATQATALRYEK